MKILFFDGYCSLCSGVVDWVMRRDKQKLIRFASLQGETARERLKISPAQTNFDTVIYLRDGEIFERSDAVLRLLRDLGAPWSALGRVGRLVPQLLRDFVYNVVAASRYRIFERRASCRMPTPDERSRLLS